MQLTLDKPIELGFLPHVYMCPVCAGNGDQEKMVYSKEHVFTAAEAHPKSPPEARYLPPELHSMWKASIYKCNYGHVLLISDP